MTQAAGTTIHIEPGLAEAAVRTFVDQGGAGPAEPLPFHGRREAIHTIPIPGSGSDPSWISTHNGFSGSNSLRFLKP